MSERGNVVKQKQRGLYGKFCVRRVDGRDASGGDKQNADYFVLDHVHDPHALPALRAYAESCADEYPALAGDLRGIVANIERKLDR